MNFRDLPGGIKLHKCCLDPETITTK